MEDEMWNLELAKFFFEEIKKEKLPHEKYAELKEKHNRLDDSLSKLEEGSLEYEEQLNEWISITYELSEYYEMDSHIHEREAQKYLYDYYRENYLKLKEY